MRMPRIRFQIVPPIDRSQESLSILGVHELLGGGDVSRAMELRWEPPFHVGEIEIPRGEHLRFRVIRTTGKALEVDAFGRRVAERAHEVFLDATLEYIVADWEDRFAGCLEGVTVTSRLLGCDRELMVWLPPSYFNQEFAQFPLILGFDGARFFDPRTSPSGIDWALDEWVGLLSRRGVMPESIVVGIVQSLGTSEEGIPLRDVELSEENEGRMFTRFVIEEVVPFLEQRYRTIPKGAARTLIGTGLGALRAFWTSIKHPDVFSRTVCLSTSFEDISQSIPSSSLSLLALEKMECAPGIGRFYFDYGDTGLDECYEIYHSILGGLLSEHGWIFGGGDLVVHRVAGGRHDDSSWRHRVGDALRWVAS
jgi:hypothetical protein